MSSKQGWMTCFSVWSPRDQVSKGRCGWATGLGGVARLLTRVTWPGGGGGGPGPPGGSYRSTWVCCLHTSRSWKSLISTSGTRDGHSPSQEWRETACLKMFFKLGSPVCGLFCFVSYVLIFITRANPWSSMPCWVNCINPESQMGARKVNWPLILFSFIWFASLRFKTFWTFRPLRRRACLSLVCDLLHPGRHRHLGAPCTSVWWSATWQNSSLVYPSQASCKHPMS